MKNLEALVSELSESVKKAFKSKRIVKALEYAKLNVQEEYESALEAVKIAPDVCKDKSAEEVINYLATAFTNIDNKKFALDILDQVEKYLNEDFVE